VQISRPERLRFGAAGNIGAAALSAVKKSARRATTIPARAAWAQAAKARHEELSSEGDP
jgi:hypothetical protein